MAKQKEEQEQTRMLHEINVNKTLEVQAKLKAYLEAQKLES